jgi:hypothetical protein
MLGTKMKLFDQSQTVSVDKGSTTVERKVPIGVNRVISTDNGQYECPGKRNILLLHTNVVMCGRDTLTNRCLIFQR